MGLIWHASDHGGDDEFGGGQLCEHLQIRGSSVAAVTSMDHCMAGEDRRAAEDEADSLSLFGAVSLGTGVMIGTGIFALIG